VDNASSCAVGFFSALSDYSDQYPALFQNIQERSIFQDFVDLARMLHPHLKGHKRREYWLPFETAFLQATNLPEDFFDTDPSSVPTAPLTTQPSPTEEEVNGREEVIPRTTTLISTSALRGHWDVSDRLAVPDVVAHAPIAEIALQSETMQPETVSSGESHRPESVGTSPNTSAVPPTKTPKQPGEEVIPTTFAHEPDGTLMSAPELRQPTVESSPAVPDNVTSILIASSGGTELHKSESEGILPVPSSTEYPLGDPDSDSTKERRASASGETSVDS
jgi:hypothetical protein